MSYTRKIKFSSTNRYGNGPSDEDDVYTIEEFTECVRGGWFIDFDGHGHPAKDNLEDVDIFIKPSRLHVIPKDATHIVWYNR